MLLNNNDNHNLIKFEQQPHFPMEDLTDANADMLKYTLDSNPGIDAYAEFLQDHQRYMYMIANHALQSMGIKTEQSPAELYSFSHGFSGFETISSLVSKPQEYDNLTATSRIAEYFIDTSPSSEPEYEDDFAAEMDKEIFSRTVPEESPIEDDESLMEKEYPDMEIPKDIIQTLAAAKRRRDEEKWGRTDRDRTDSSKLFMDKFDVLPEQYPNTYDVIVTMGTTRHETMSQLHLRAAGALLARSMQTID